MEQGMFGKIRKTAENLAQTKAEKENLAAPEARHYHDAFASLKYLKMVDAEATKKLIDATASMLDIKADIGPEGQKAIEEALAPKNAEFAASVQKEYAEIDTLEISANEKSARRAAAVEKNLKIMIQEASQDQNVKKAFAGREEVLDGAISAMGKEITSLGESIATFQEKLG